MDYKSEKLPMNDKWEIALGILPDCQSGFITVWDQNARKEFEAIEQEFCKKRRIENLVK